MRNNETFIRRLLVLLLMVSVFWLVVQDAATAMEPPTDKMESTYDKSAYPELQDDPSKAKPIGLGSMATYGDELDIKFLMSDFTNAVDIYVGFNLQGKDYLFTEAGGIVDYSKTDTDKAWRKNNKEGLYKSIVKIGKSDVAALRQDNFTDEITLFTTVANTGVSIDDAQKANKYYYWTTKFRFKEPTTTSECTITIDPSQSAATLSSGQTGSFTVNVSGSCTWTATVNPTDASKVTITTGSSGAATGTVSYKVNANAGSGTADINIYVSNVLKATHTVNLTSTSAKLTVTLTGSGTVTSSPSGIDCGSDCTESYDVGKSVTLTATPSGNVFTGASNFTGWSGGGCSGTTETCTVTMDSDKGVTAAFSGSTTTTSACTITVDPSQSANKLSAGQTASFSVNVSGSCSWTATVNPTDAGRVTITSGSSGTGSGTVNYKVADTTGTGDATINIYVNNALQATHTVRLSACVTSISPTSQSFNSSGATGSVTVNTADSSCQWTATESLDWVTITTGSGKVDFTVAANNGSTRSGTITISGNTFTITQTGCITISPSSQSFAISGGSGSITVTAAESSCTWTATGYPDWVTIISGSSGTGSGAVSFTASANSGSARSGSITIAGSTFSVSQSGQQSSISFGSVPTGTWSSFYTLNAIEQAVIGASVTTNAPAPNYGRSAYFYKITTPSAGCPGKVDIVAGGSPAQNPGNVNMVASDVDQGSQESWWAYYFKYFASDGANPNNGDNGNMPKYISAKSGVYSGTMKFDFSTSYEEERLTIGQVNGNITFYIMVIGEGWTTASSYRIMWSCT